MGLWSAFLTNCCIYDCTMEVGDTAGEQKNGYLKSGKENPTCSLIGLFVGNFSMSK